MQSTFADKQKGEKDNYWHFISKLKNKLGNNPHH